MRVLRPVHEGWGDFAWAHIDNGGKPLCGREPGPGISFQVEIVLPAQFTPCPNCWHAYKNYQVESLQSGQPGPYQDSQYIYRVTDLADEKRSREEVLAYCQERVRKSYKREDMPSWSSPELREFSQLKPGVWRYSVREAYTG